MITLLYGDNLPVKNSSLKKLLNGERAERLYAGTVESDRIIGALQNTSLFGGGGAPSVIYDITSDPVASDFLVDALEKNASLNNVVLMENKVNKGSRLMKRLVASDNATIQHFESPKPYEMGRWIKNHIENLGGSISTNDANFAASYLGSETGSIAMEVEKMLSVQMMITEKLIKKFCAPSPEGTVFNLLDLIGAGNTSKALETAELLLLQSDQARKIQAMLGWQTLNWVTVHSMKNKPDSAIAKASKISPYVVKKAREQVQGMSKKEIKQLTTAVAEAERSLIVDFTDAKQTILNEVALLSKLF